MNEGDVLAFAQRGPEAKSGDCVAVSQSLTADTGTELAEIH